MAFEKKTWKSGDVITYNAMNRLEEQVAENADKLSNIDSMDSLRDQIAAMVRNEFDPISEQISETEEILDDLVTKTNIYGSSEVDNGGEASLKDWISAQIANLGDDITALEGTDTRIKNALGSVYDVTNPEWTLGANKSIDARLIELHNAIFGDSEATGESLTDKVEDVLGRPLEPTAEEIAENSNYGSSLLALIEVIQTTLGMNGGSASGSLVDSIENALGRPLTPTEQEKIQDPALAKSLYQLIQEIRSTLGMEGASGSASTSTLISDVDSALNLLYGYTKIVENGETIIERNTAPVLANLNIINSYPTLYDDFYNASVSYTTPRVDSEGHPVLDENDEPIYDTVTQNGSVASLLTGVYNRMNAVSATNDSLVESISDYDDVKTKANNSYESAETETYGEDTYLILKRNREATNAESLDDFSETGEYNNSTYIQLPKGGGGGGSTPLYTLQAKFVDVVQPSETSIVIGNSCPIQFTWQVRDEDDNAAQVNGNLVLRLNGTIVYTTTIESNTPISPALDLGRFITTSGRNNFTITVTNAAASTKTLYSTITAYEAILTDVFDEETVYTGSSIEYSYLASIGSTTITKVLHISIDDVELTLSNNETRAERQNSVIFSTPASGDHIMKVWFTAQISETSTISSAVKSYGILCGTSIGTRIASNFINGTEVERYDNLIVRYKVVTTNQETTPVSIYIDDSETPVFSGRVNSQYQTWSYAAVGAPGTLTITIRANNAEKVLTATIVDTNNYDFSMVTSNLSLFLTANLRSNNEANPRSWINSANNSDIGIQMNNFLFYKNIDGWQQDDDGAYFLRLRNQNQVVIPFSIFNSDILTKGMTFEIDFKTRDVADYGTYILQCFEGETFNTSSDSKYVALTPQSAIINNTASLATQYKEEEKITLDFVVNPRNASGNERGLIYIYLNGILSGAVNYADSSVLAFNNPSTAKIVLGSSEVTLDLYSIKVYERPLTYREVIQNWIYNTPAFSEKIERYTRNHYEGQTLTITEFTHNSPNTPYMVITGNGPLDGDNAYMPQAKGTNVNVDIEYYNPTNPAFNFSATGLASSLGASQAAVQGTSSQAYYRKNYKIKLKRFIQNGIVHYKKDELSDDDYNITYDNEGQEVSRELKDNVVKEGYKLSDTSYPTYTFCIKADVASSESANNTCLVKIYDEGIRKYVLTPPQADDPRIRQGVEGYPMVAWYRYTDANNVIHEILLGKYNFNNDKGTDEVYGFITDTENDLYDESWEVKNNSNPLVVFEVNGDKNTETRENTWFGTYVDEKGNTVYNWTDAFESRYPDQDDEGLTSQSLDYIKNRLAGLREMVEWVNDTVIWTDNTKTAVTTDSLNAFKTGFEKYFNLEAMLFFYVFTEFFLMVDNRAKNMFWTRYAVALGLRPKTSYSEALSAALAPDDKQYFGWFSLPYDFDTAIGINNQGKNVFDYHWESLDVKGPDGLDIFGGQHSKLWVAFAAAYPQEIATVYNEFANDWPYYKVEELFETNQSIWSEVITNEDMIVKYIDWWAGKQDPLSLPMLLGLKDLQRKWWLSNRYKYYNSKYALERGIDNINMRIHVNNVNIPVEVYGDSYVSINVGANGTPVTTRVLRGQEGLLYVPSSGGGADSSGTETFISPASRLKSVKNLYTFKASSLNYSNATKLQTLQIGSPDAENYANEGLQTVSVGNSESTSLLRHFDMRNCVNYTNDLELSSCLFLNSVYLAGTKITKVNLPDGGVLRTIQYPETITEIKIENQPYLTNLIIGSDLPADEITEEDAPFVNEFDIANNDYSNITSIVLDNIGESVNVPNIVVQSENLASCSLNALVFRMISSAFKTFFDKLVDVNATVTNCTLYLEDDLSTVGMTVNDITDKFDIKIYDKTGAEYFNVRFYDFEGKWLATRSVASGSSVLTNDIDNYFTPEVEYTHNNITADDLANYETIQGFGGWNVSLQNITTDLEARPVEVTKYRMAYHYLQDYTTRAIQYLYFAENANITRIAPPVFIYEYNQYNASRWTADSNEPENYPEEDERTAVSQNALKQAYSEDWYLCYTTSAAVYQIRVYNTDTEGNKTELLGSFERTAIGSNTTVTFADLQQYMPAEGTIAINSTELNIPVEEREYQFLCWQPKVTSSEAMQVVGDTDILLRYYKTDDVYTNYFLNKITELELSENVTRLPPGSFMNNSNLTKLITYAENIGENSFSAYFKDAPDNKIRYFVFKGDNVTFEEGCFYYLGTNSQSTADYSTVIIFEGTGQFAVKSSCFNAIKNCIIIIRNSDLPIRQVGLLQSFSSFYGNNNKIYVSDGARDAYNNDSAVPDQIKNNAGSVVLRVSNNMTSGINIKSILEEVGINVD